MLRLLNKCREKILDWKTVEAQHWEGTHPSLFYKRRDPKVSSYLDVILRIQFGGCPQGPLDYNNLTKKIEVDYNIIGCKQTTLRYRPQRRGKALRLWDPTVFRPGQQ